MVDCSGQLSGWPVPVAGSANPVQSATQELALLRGGYSTLQETAIMQNPKPNPSDLQAKISDVSYWMEHVDNAIASQSLTGCDLVCLQCELEELTELVIVYREALRIELDTQKNPTK